MSLKSTDHRPDGPSPRARRCLALAAALCSVLFAASLVIAPPASAQDVTIWSADLEVKTLNAAQDEFGCSHTTPFNGQCANSNVLSDDDFSLHGNPYTITRIEDDGSELELTLDTALPSNVLEFLTLHVGDDTELAFEDARVSSSNKRYTWSSSPSWSLGDKVDLSITDASGPSLVKNTSLDDNERNLFENGHRSAQAFTAGTWARVTLIGIGIGDEVDDDVEVTLHKGGGSNPGDRLKTLENPGSITEDAVNVFTVPDGGIVLEASKTYFVQVKTTSSDRVAVSVTGPLSGGNAEDDGAAENWTIDNGSWTNRPSIGAWQASNQSMRIDVKGEVLLDPPTNPSARAVAPMRVTLRWDRTLPSPKGTIDRDDGYKIEWSADGNDPWTSLVNVTNQYVTDSDIWCTCYPTRFNDNTITPGTTRHYRIKAVDDDDESAWSDSGQRHDAGAGGFRSGPVRIRRGGFGIQRAHRSEGVPNRLGSGRELSVHHRGEGDQAPGDRDRPGRHGDLERRAGSEQHAHTEIHDAGVRRPPGQDLARRESRTIHEPERGMVPVRARAGAR